MVDLDLTGGALRRSLLRGAASGVAAQVVFFTQTAFAGDFVDPKNTDGVPGCIPGRAVPEIGQEARHSMGPRQSGALASSAGGVIA